MEISSQLDMLVTLTRGYNLHTQTV